MNPKPRPRTSKHAAEALLLDEMFSPVLAEALRADGFDVIAVLFTGSRRFPRSRRNPAPLHFALRDLLGADQPRGDEEWLR